MGESDGSWGQLAADDPDLAAQWDKYSALPEPGVNAPLDSLVERKRITHGALVRLGARLSDPNVLAFAFPGGIKYRDMVDDRRWGSNGAEFHSLKILPATEGDGMSIIVAEGETDAARLTLLFPGCSVAVLPAGALRFTAKFAEQLEVYERVFVGLDDDIAGNEGALKITAFLPQAIRFTPPANDWCAVDEAPELPEAEPAALLPSVVFGAALVGLEAPEQASWFEGALLPIGGLMILHGWAKSFKSFMAFDLMSAIATGNAWAGFEPAEEPTRVGIVQWEIPWAYYQQRALMMRGHAIDQDLWDTNYGTWEPLTRPRLVPGNTKSEDTILRGLAEARVEVVLFDPIRRMAGTLDLNSEQDMRRIFGFFERLNREGLTVVATHHDNKLFAKQGGGDMLGMTGAGTFGGDPDTVVSVALPKGMTLESPRRNLHFALRNAPAASPRGFTMREDGSVLYSTEPFGPDDAESDADDSAPAI